MRYFQHDADGNRTALVTGRSAPDHPRQVAVKEAAADTSVMKVSGRELVVDEALVARRTAAEEVPLVEKGK
jgi:hypothetical protein